MKISIIIPVYNEVGTVESVLSKVASVQLANIEKEIVVVDDGSTDGTTEVLKKLSSKYKIYFHDRNYGKGAAVRKGYRHATGDFIINQDADLEYDPNDYQVLLAPIQNGTAEVVFGSRRLDPSKNHYVYRRYLWGGVFTNWLVNLIAGIKVNDVFSGSKVFPRDALLKVNLASVGFEIETELTIKLLKAGYKVLEVPISYQARTIEAGKKIRPTDALKIIWTAIRSR